ncbi:MAG: hypothetical protein JST92_05500 [Deltaproteobacteria bacterium]|nr:hypothetical protein [Deltaproteobacteria bacterium]
MHPELVRWILLVTGVITCAPILQFVAPKLAMKLMYKLELTEPAGAWFARHWGLCAFVVGLLILYSTAHPQVMRPALGIALIEKAGLALTLLLAWNQPWAKGLRGAALFDTVCSVLYTLILLRIL